jgi:hypothetical protein
MMAMLKEPATHSPARLFEANIVHNPRTWFGVWTPRGWRVHRKRWGKAQRLTRYLSGDGETTVFRGALIDRDSKRGAWQDDLHLESDSFSDAGIYPADPRVEYALDQPRWAVSHTLLCYPVADHNLFTHEYTWDPLSGDLHTHFREHVLLEEATTDASDGMTVRVRKTPISQTVEGNEHYPRTNSAVRGVWGNPAKRGENLYTRRTVQRLSMLNAVYCVTPRVPVVQCHGIWPVLPGDPAGGLFDETGECRDRQRLAEQCLMDLDHPRIGMLAPPLKSMHSEVYEGAVPVLSEFHGIVDEAHLEQLRSRIGTRFEPARVGYASAGEAHNDAALYRGYDARFDINGDGVIDETDAQVVEQHLRKRVRLNLYRGGYFGGDWISTGALLAPEHRPGIPIIADYEFGGGYDADTGVIRLLRTPGPNKRVWVEYFCDVPAAKGENNIRVHFYRET